MHSDTLQKVKTLTENFEHFFVATVDPQGQPHIAAAGALSIKNNGIVEITDWFCSTTVDNLRDNSRISVVVWDHVKDLGYQLLGKAERMEDIAMMNGYSPELGETISMPQVERKLIVRVHKILDFSQRSQSDVEK